MAKRRDEENEAFLRGLALAIPGGSLGCEIFGLHSSSKFSDKFGHRNCVILRNSRKAASCVFGSYRAIL